MPESAIKDLKNICMLSDESASKFVTEYRKYLLLHLIASFKITPGHKLDYVWHSHLFSNHTYPR